MKSKKHPTIDEKENKTSDESKVNFTDAINSLKQEFGRPSGELVICPKIHLKTIKKHLKSRGCKYKITPYLKSNDSVLIEPLDENTQSILNSMLLDVMPPVTSLKKTPLPFHTNVP